MNLGDAVREQLLAIGIDESGPAPPEQVTPESSDISWNSQMQFLGSMISEAEYTALRYLLAHPRVPRESLPQLMMFQDLIEGVIESSWPRRAEGS